MSDDIEFPDPCSPAFKHGLLQDARKDFAVFYRTATAIDASLMDCLEMAPAALVPVFNLPRENLPPLIRTELERATSANEQFFTELRERVRACPTFQALRVENQLLIEWGVFKVAPSMKDRLPLRVDS